MNHEHDNLDPDTADVPDVAKMVNTTASKVESIQQDTADIRSYIQGVHAQNQRAQEEETRQAVAEEIYSACDEEHGAQYRSEAMKLADEMVDSGKVAKPTSATQGLRLMQKCYAEVAAKSQAAAKPRELTPASVQHSKEFKPGTLEEVAKDMRKKMSEGAWKRRFADPGV